MAIATTHTSPSATTAAQGAQAAHHRGKASDKPAAGFSALLDGIGLAAEDAPALQEPAQRATQKDDADKPGTAQPDAAAQAAPAQTPADTRAGKADDTADDETALRAARRPQAEQPQALRPGAVALADADAQTANAQAAPTEAAPESIAELVARLRGSPGGPAAAEARAQEAEEPHRATVDLAGAARDRAQRATQAAMARALSAESARSAVLAQAHQAATAALAETRESSGSRDLRRGAASGAESSLSALSQVLAALEDSGLAVADRGRESQGGASSSFAGTSSGLGAQGFAPRAAEAGGVTSFATVAAEQQVAPQELLASQVSVWVSDKVQSAELQLDGFGDKPVQVEIALDGQQAHVRFSSDQPQVRELLQSAAGELRQLLKDEGLQLAGLSVGSWADGAAAGAGRDAPGGQGRGDGTNRSGLRQEAAAAPAGAAQAPARPARPQGMLDLFA